MTLLRNQKRRTFYVAFNQGSTVGPTPNTFENRSRVRESAGAINTDVKDTVQAMIQPEPPDIEKSPSQHFRHGSSDAIRKVLNEVENESRKRVKDGFSEINFTLGVFNCFIITYMFAAFPQHLWIVYILEGKIHSTRYTNSTRKYSSVTVLILTKEFNLFQPFFSFL